MELHEPRSKKPGEDIFGWMFLVVSVGLFWQSYAIAGFSALSSPGAFPIAVSAIMIVAAVIVVAGNLLRTREQNGEAILPRDVAIFIVLMVAYAFAIEPLGFLPSSLIFLFVGMKLLYRGGWVASAVISIGALIAIYVVFRLVFQVVLPEGIVPEGEWLAAIRGLFSGGQG